MQLGSFKLFVLFHLRDLYGDFITLASLLTDFPHEGKQHLFLPEKDSRTSCFEHVSSYEAHCKHLVLTEHLPEEWLIWPSYKRVLGRKKASVALYCIPTLWLVFFY